MLTQFGEESTIPLKYDLANSLKYTHGRHSDYLDGTLRLV